MSPAITNGWLIVFFAKVTLHRPVLQDTSPGGCVRASNELHPSIESNKRRRIDSRHDPPLSIIKILLCSQCSYSLTCFIRADSARGCQIYKDVGPVSLCCVNKQIAIIQFANIYLLILQYLTCYSFSYETLLATVLRTKRNILCVEYFQRYLKIV